VQDAWTIEGSSGEPIIGDCHHPDGDPRGVVLVAHGFKGYKDYGMFPRIARTLAGEAGVIAHRFNFSHSGMTNDIETFARPDLFERDTWNRQVDDLRAVVAAVADGTLAGAGLPLVLFGHSRGGVTTLLTAGRGLDETPAGVVTAAAPSACNRFPQEIIDAIRSEGFVESPSSRTGQVLRVGRAFIDEQDADPAGHDLLGLAARIECPVLIVHGADDPTVPAGDAQELAAAIGERAEVVVVPGGDHVFNTPNPMPDDQAPSAQLQQVLDALVGFVGRVCV
jgi:dienelactone hydrolase